jgi:hypothetical protein
MASETQSSETSEHPQHAKSHSVIKRVLSWLTAGYPDGVPGPDKLPVIAVLQRHLTETEVRDIAAQLTAEGSPALADGGISADEVEDLVRKVLLEEPAESDIRRVSARLAAGGWPLASSPYADDAGPV